MSLIDITTVDHTGTRYTYKVNGSEMREYQNGTVIWIYTDGTIKRTDPNGDIIT